MKKIYTVLLITLCISELWAQSPDKKISYLVKGGLNISNYAASESKIVNDIGEDKSLTGFNLSALVNYRISNTFTLQAGLSFNQKGYINQFEVEDRGENNEYLGTTIINKSKQRVTYLELHINAIYNYKS